MSPSFGAGWSTWNDSPQEVAEYQPIIEFIEAGGNPGELDKDHPLIKQMQIDLNIKDFYTGGNDSLEVEDVEGGYLITEYDGSETVITSADFR